MRIISLDIRHIAIPFATPYKLSKAYGTLSQAHAVILKLETDAGLAGWGEADPMNPFTEETPATVMAATRDLMAPHVLGRDPRDLAEIEFGLDRTVFGHLLARGAVNMALYDILGKIHGLPVHAFLGGVLHRQLPLLGGIGSGSPAEDAEAAEALLEQGYRSVMIKMGAQPIEREIQRLLHARKRFSGRLEIIVDANQGWDASQSLRFIEAIRDAAPELIEQPVPRWDLPGLRRIRLRAPCPVSVDESLVTVHDAADIIGQEAADVFSIKVSKNGGLDKSRQIAHLGLAFGKRCLMNSMLEFGITQAASLQLGCTLPNLVALGHAYGSVLRMADDFTDFHTNIHHGTVTVPSRRGLGISVDNAKLDHYTLEELKLHADD